MVLETSDDRPLAAPDEAAIDQALQRLLDRRLDWLALVAGPHHVVSIARGNRGLVVEVARDRVRRCRRELIPEETAEVLRAVARGEAQWEAALAWDDVTNENGWVYLVLLAATVVMALLLASRLMTYLRSQPTSW